MAFCFSLAIATKNKHKIKVVSKVFSKHFADILDVHGVDVPSMVPETPYNDETPEGAMSRCRQLADREGDDYCVGIESGLVERYGYLFEEVWAAVSNGAHESIGYSSGLFVSDRVTEIMKLRLIGHFVEVFKPFFLCYC